MAEYEWQEQKSKRKKKSNSTSEVMSPPETSDSSKRRPSLNFNSRNQNSNYETCITKKGDITLWMEYVVIGNIEKLIIDKLQILSIGVDDKIDNLWNCLFYQLQKYLKLDEAIKNSDDLYNEINLMESENMQKRFDYMPNFCKKYNLQLRISSIDRNVKDIIYGKNLSRSIHLLHIGMEYFLSLKLPFNSKYSFSAKDNQIILKLNECQKIVPVNQCKLTSEKKHLEKIRKLLRGKEKTEEYVPETKNYKKRLLYDIYTQEHLNKIRNQLIICQLQFQNAHSGIAIPLESTEKINCNEIKLNSRRNCGYNCFQNDKVYVLINDPKNHTGKVMGLFESNHKPVNSIYICKVSTDQGSLMSPLDKSFPKIHVDNEPGRRKYESEDLIKIRKQSDCVTKEQKSVVDIERESKKFADNVYYSVFKISMGNSNEKPTFQIDHVSRFNPETCEFFFIVCYEYWDPYFMYPNGRIVGILSCYESLNDNFHLITSICNIEPLDITATYRKEVEEIEKKCKTIDYVPNTYLPHGAIVFTIDNENTRDMDDAISYHKEGDEIVIGIHISDVTKYISSTHDIYRQAQQRFCTTYPPKFANIPILHLLNDKLATNILSLVPNQPRAVVSVIFRFKESMLNTNFNLSEITKPTFKTGVIVSKYKLNYENVSNWIRQSEKPNDIDEDLFIALSVIYKLAKTMRHSRLPISYFVRARSNCYKDFQIDNEFEGGNLIEEFMLLTNEYVAKKIYEKYPNLTLLRTQEPVKSFEDWINKLYQYTNMDFTAQLKEYCNLLHIEKPNENERKYLIVSRKFFDTFCNFMQIDIEKAKSLLQCDSFYNDFYVHITEWYAISNSARYVCSLENSSSNGHFSLNKPLYTHFTSPIRRFTDIIVHRLLKSIINDSEINITPSDIGEVCSIANKRHKANNTFEKLCAPFAIIEETDKKYCFILDCVCSEINDEALLFAHPLLQKASSVKQIKLAEMSLDSVPTLSLLSDGITSDSGLLKWRKIIFSCPPFDINISGSNRFVIDNHLFDSRMPNNKSKLFREIRRSYNDVEKLKDKMNELKNSFKNSNFQTVISSDCFSIADPIIDIELKLFIKNTMRIQFCKYKVNGLQKISPELYIITPTFHICLIHRKDPVRFFIPGGKLNLKHNTIQKRFRSIKDYKEYFEPLIHIESLVETLNENVAFTLLNVPVIWIIGKSPNISKKERFGIIKLSFDFCKSRNIIFSEEKDSIVDRYEYLIDKGLSSVGGDLLCLRYKKKHWDNYWVGHGEVVHVGKCKDLNDSFKVIIFMLTQCDFESFSNNEEDSYTVDVYLKSVVSKRQQEAITSIDSHPLLKEVILGTQVLSTEIDTNIITTIKNEIENKRIFKFNRNQLKAIENAMNQKLSLIWGPPGTGKTHIGCILSYAFKHRNNVRKNLGVVLYCGPSNDCVNLVAMEMRKKFNENCPKLLRIYSEQQELADFPLPGFFAKSNTKLSGELQEVSLHYLIRNQEEELAESLKRFDQKFKYILSNPEEHNKSSNVREEIHSTILAYRETLKEAKLKLIEKHQYDMVLCTTSVTASMIMNLFNITQIIIDEAGMCKEPETLIPISSAESTVENVVLIGDHKQLRPIILSSIANKGGLQISLFERYQEIKPELVTMLNFQYRMHPSICEFPSKEFYHGRLKTNLSNLWCGLSQDEMGYDHYTKTNYSYYDWNGIDYSYCARHYKSVLRQNNYDAIPNEKWQTRTKPFICFNKPFYKYPERIIFLHVVGDEVIQSVKTMDGNENSRGNKEEVEATGVIYERLISRLEPPRQSPNFVTVLTQYKLQQHLIETKCKEILKAKSIKTNAIVKTVIRSQGSENDYIIFSTVRSLRHKEDINEYPTPGWERQYLGFITDPNQVNVALTRAKKGLIIIGNKNLLRVNKIWKHLIEDLESRNCILDNYLDFL